MVEVNFHAIEEINDKQLEFAVIVSSYQNKWIFCKHKRRETWEIPGGHREKDENINVTAERELFEETGAVIFELIPVCVYSVKSETQTFGMLFYSNITQLGNLPESEIEKISLFDNIPEALTYPLIQPKLIYKVKEFLCFK